MQQTENEIKGLLSQQEAKASEIKFIGEELKGVSALYKQNLVTIVRFNALQRDQARLEGERGQLIAEASRARGKIAETELQIISLDQDFRTEVLRDLREAQAKIAELQERVNAAQDELRRIEIRAPAAGIVYQLNVHTIGGVMAKGDTIMQLVPRGLPLLVEVKVAPPDVDQVLIGAPTRVLVMAGNRRTTPELEGNVSYVSPDLTREQAGPGAAAGQAYYVVRILLPPVAIKRIGALQLVPGMPVEAYIRTDDRTPFEYILKPLQEQIARTFASDDPTLTRLRGLRHDAVEERQRAVPANLALGARPLFLVPPWEMRTHRIAYPDACHRRTEDFIERYPSVAPGPCPDTAIFSSRWEHVPEVG